MLAVAQINGGEKLSSSGSPLPSRPPTAEHGEFHVGQGRKLGQKVVELEDQTDLVAPVLAEVSYPGQVPSAHRHRATSSGSRWRQGG